MKQDRSRRIILLILSGMLVVVSGCLFSQNIEYKSANRKLILQNDSLMSVLINMNRKADRSDAAELSISEQDGDREVND